MRSSLLAGASLGALLLGGALGASAQAPAPARAGTPGFRGALERSAIARASRRDSTRFDDVFRKYTKRYFGMGYDWRFFKAQGMAESELNPTAKSWVGARGIMQLMPSTFGAIQSKRPEFTSIDDPEWNIAAGIMHDRYLYTLWKKWIPDEERERFMFASYNAGEGTITRARGVAKAANLDTARWTSIERVAPTVQRWRYRETLGYVRRIEANYTRLQRERAAPRP